MKRPHERSFTTFRYQKIGIVKLKNKLEKKRKRVCNYIAVTDVTEIT